MTMLAHWDHIRHAGAVDRSEHVRTALKVLKGAAVAVAIAAVTIALVAIRVYVFVPGLR